jgi:hypothetical protein
VPAVYGEPPAVAFAEMAGAVRVMLMPPKVLLTEFPATSVHVAVTDWSDPVLVTVAASGFEPLVVVVDPLVDVRLENPDPLSAQENVTVTF